MQYCTIHFEWTSCRLFSHFSSSHLSQSLQARSEVAESSGYVCQWYNRRCESYSNQQPQCISCSCLTLFKVSWWWTTCSIGLFTTSTTTARLVTSTMHSSMVHSWMLSSCSPCKLYIVGGCGDLGVGESYQQSQSLQVSFNTLETVRLIYSRIARVRCVCQWSVCRHLCEFLLSSFNSADRPQSVVVDPATARRDKPVEEVCTQHSCKSETCIWWNDPAVVVCECCHWHYDCLFYGLSGMSLHAIILVHLTHWTHHTLKADRTSKRENKPLCNGPIEAYPVVDLGDKCYYWWTCLSFSICGNANHVLYSHNGNCTRSYVLHCACFGTSETSPFLPVAPISSDVLSLAENER